jgi:hypothetical protein
MGRYGRLHVGPGRLAVHGRGCLATGHGTETLKTVPVKHDELEQGVEYRVDTKKRRLERKN